jgi:hypothetical protein
LGDIETSGAHDNIYWMLDSINSLDTPRSNAFNFLSNYSGICRHERLQDTISGSESGYGQHIHASTWITLTFDIPLGTLE